MTKDVTIAVAAEAALRLIGRDASIDEIYESIISNQLYEFETPVPKHVLRTTIRRHTDNLKRKDSFSTKIFHMSGSEIYGISFSGGKKTMKKALGIRRIHRAKNKEHIIASLTSAEIGIFKEIWRLLLFSAQVGITNSRREPLGDFDSGKGIDQSTFGNCPSWPGILFLMSITESGDSSALSNAPDTEDSRIQRFEEYANGGLAVLEEFLDGRIVDLDGILAFIETQSPKSSAEPDLDFTI